MQEGICSDINIHISIGKTPVQTIMPTGNANYNCSVRSLEKHLSANCGTDQALCSREIAYCLPLAGNQPYKREMLEQHKRRYCKNGILQPRQRYILEIVSRNCLYGRLSARTRSARQDVRLPCLGVVRALVRASGR